MARGERELKVKLLGDSRSAEGAFNRVDGKSKQLEGRLGKTAGVARNLFGPAMATAAIGIGVELFKTGVALEQMAAKAEKVFGAEIANVRKWADENAIAMGLTRREAVGLAANMADLLIPMGFVRKDAADMSQKVIGLAGALSAWSAGKYTAAEVSEILTKAMLGEREQLKGLGISLDAAEIKQRLVEKGQQDLTGAALQMAEALATQELVFEKSKDAQDAFNDSTKTTAEKMTEAQGRFKDAKEELAEGLLPVLIGATEKMNNYVQSTFHATDATKGLQGAAYDLGGTLYDAWERIGEIIDRNNILQGQLSANAEDRAKAIALYSGGGAKPKDSFSGPAGGGNWTQNVTVYTTQKPEETAREVAWRMRGGKAS